jgi:uncharacterized protein (TIGR03435 family)
MKRPADASGIRRKLWPSVAGLVAFAASIIFGVIHSTPCRAQSQAQDKSAQKHALEFDVASIKRVIPGSVRTNLSGRIGTSDTPDGLVGRFVTVKMLILRAYAVDDYQISGAMDWVNSERYDIDAKFDSSAADELLKLGPNDRILARQQMLQTLLTERFSLKVHRETKEVQLYVLVVAKNGPKLQEVKLDDTESSKSKGGPPPGTGYMTAGPSVGQMRGYASLIANLTGMLTRYLHRPVIDRTGLTGRYDFTLRWTPDENQPQASSNSQGSPGFSLSGLPASDPTGSPTLFTAIQEQLGLKLESAKGPIEFIVIDHVERPSGN